MQAKKRNSGEICSRCGKQLRLDPCGQCDGKGYQRELIFLKRDCEACGGAGKQLRCPNELDHILEDFKLPKETPQKHILKGFQDYSTRKPSLLTPKPTQLTSMKPTTPPVPPPWHPSYPFPWHPMHPRNPNNPLNPNSPLNPNNPTNINNPLNPLNPINIHKRMNRNNPIHPPRHKPFGK